MKKTDGDTHDIFFFEYRQASLDAFFAEFDERTSILIHPLTDGQAQPARNQWFWPVDIDVVLLETIFIRHLERIAMTLREKGTFAHLHMERQAQRLSINGNTSRGEVHEHYDVDDDVLVTSRSVAAEAMAARRLAGLAVGDSLVMRRKVIALFPAFQIVDSTLTYRRLPDEQVELPSGDVVPARIYEAHRAGDADGDSMARVVADYIAGMTDRFAIAEHERLA